MIEISERAQAHFRHLLATQGGPGWGVRIRARDGGTPRGECELAFCEPGDVDGGEVVIACDGFSVYVDGPSARWFEGAAIDYDVTATGGELAVRAPHLRSAPPDADAGLAAQVGYVLETEINPRLAAHRGNVSLREVEADGTVVLQFGGGCHGCGAVDATLRQGVEKTLRERIPAITAVRDATDHSRGEDPYYRGSKGASALGG
jgi:Fe/S biogenesis protein NfuA